MKVVCGYRTELDLNDKQRTACMKHAGASRFAYNWGLARSKGTYHTTGKRPTAIDLHRELNKLKQTDYPWMYEVSKCAPQEALRDLDKAYKNFFRRMKRKSRGLWRGKLGFPKFKKRSKAIGSFRLTGSIKVFSDAVQLSRLGRLRLHEHNFICEAYGLVIDRDLNAALNLLKEALRTTGSFSESDASGQDSSGTLNGVGETALEGGGTNHPCGLSTHV
jgi:transposase